MQITPHFSLAELTHTDTGLPNVPDAAATANLQLLALALEKVRAALGGKAIHINSAYRSKAVNAAVGGAVASRHLQGLAADFVCPGYGAPAKVALAVIDAGISFDKIVLEPGWLHFAVSRTAPRKQVMTCVAPDQYIPGLHPDKIKRQK